MDIQIVDENSKHRNVMQDFELEEVLEYAEKWAEISNNANKNSRVKQLIKNIRGSVKRWKEDAEAKRDEDKNLD